MKTILFLLACALPMFTGCGTTSYKAAAVSTVTAEHASDAWLDYYVAAKKLPGADLVGLAAQDFEAEKAWRAYQDAMETVYHTRLAVKAGQAEPADLDKVLIASQSAAQAVVRIVLRLLPPERAAKLKGSP